MKWKVILIVLWIYALIGGSVAMYELIIRMQVIDMYEKVCATCKHFKFLSTGRNIGQCLYRKQYMYGNDKKCANYTQTNGE